MKRVLICSVFKRYRKIVISMILISALCYGMMTGLLNVYASLNETFKKYIADYGIADAQISTEITDSSAEEILVSIPGISRVETRLTITAQILSPSGKILGAYITSLGKEEIQKLYRWEELDHLSEDSVLMELRFAQANHINLGEQIRVQDGEDYRAFRVAGFVSSPETLSGAQMEGTNAFYPDIGFIYAPISILKLETEREYARMKAEWDEKEAEYIQAEKEAKKAWEKAETELAEAQKELAGKEKEFSESKKELEEQVKNLTDARLELMLGRKEFDDTEKTAEERKEQLTEALARIETQEAELKDRETELEEARNNLNSLLIQLENARGRLAVTRGTVSSYENELNVMLRMMRQARTAWNAVREFEAREFTDQADIQAQTVVAEAEETLKEKGITPETLNNTIRQAETGQTQLQSGKNRIQDGIKQITESFIPGIQSYLEETEQALALVAEMQEALKTAKKEIQNGLKALADFEKDAPSNREELEQKLQEVELAIKEINSGLAEGETALTESRDLLDEKTEEAEEAHQEAEEELAEGSEQLKDAWEELSSWKGYTPMRNEYLLEFDPAVDDRAAVLEKAVEALNGNVKKAVLYEDSSVAEIIHGNLEIWDVMGLFIPAVFTALVVFILFLFLSMMIRQSKRDIGILRALGIGKHSIRGVFSIVCLLMILMSILIGGLLGIPLRNLVNRHYQGYFYFPSYVHAYNVKGALLVAALLIGVTQMAALLITSMISHVQPAETMTRQTNSSKPILPGADRLLHRLKPMTKFSLLTLIRNWKRFAVSTLCLACSAAIMLVAIAFHSSTDDAWRQMFGLRIHYDCQIMFSTEPTDETKEMIRSLPYMEDLKAVRSYSVNLEYGEKESIVSLIAMDGTSEMLIVPDEKGESLQIPENGIVLTEWDADTFNVRTGDLIRVNGIPMEVTALSCQSGTMNRFISAAQAESLGMPEQYVYLARLPEDKMQDMISLLQNQEGYIMTINTRTMQETMSGYMEQFAIFSVIIIGFAVLLGFFTVINIHQTNLQEQKQELCILRALGFQHRGISAYWFLHSVLYFLCALVIGFPLGKKITTIVLGKISNSGFNMIYVEDLSQYVLTAGILLAFLILGHFWSMITMKKWNIVENVKDRE